MNCGNYIKVFETLFWIQCVKCMYHGSEEDIAELLKAKNYLPDNKDLPSANLVKINENDSTYILSKLADDDLLKLLNKFPKKSESDTMDKIDNLSIELNRNQRVSVQNEPQSAVFRLENREVDPYADTIEGDPKFKAHQKLNNILYSRPQPDMSIEDDEKEKMFNILVSQLRTLCCKKNKPQKYTSTLAKKIQSVDNKQAEHIFLVLNDEIQSNTTENLIPVDPDSLARNSSVLLLGPITTPLSDVQTKVVITRLTNELSKPEYLPLLHELSIGKLGKNNNNLVSSFIYGPETRRYVKPHRCNHQSKLAKIHAGPKWIICTGYLNLNIPSLYD